MNRQLASAVVVMLIVAGCGGSGSPTSPPPVGSLAGTWSGKITDPISGEGTAQMSLSDQAQNRLTGTWSATFKNGSTVSGPASASLNSGSVAGIMLNVNPQPACAGSGASDPLGYTLINVAVTSSRLTAVAGRISCNGFGFGAVDLSRQ